MSIVPRVWGILVAAGVIVAAASTGSFRRFERFSLALCFFSVLLVPVFLMVHPPIGEIARDLVVPHFPAGAKLSDVMLLVIAIVGTTVAPWQLFFQQSYVIDKRITPRFMIYGKADLLIGIGFVVVGAVAMMAFAAAAFGGTAGFGQFTDAGAVAAGLEVHAGRADDIPFRYRNSDTHRSAMVDRSCTATCQPARYFIASAPIQRKLDK
jgi:Mn2+/Fe2+ NRAMP family transporter